MEQRLVTFYGTLCEKGYVISYLLIDKRIQHDFVITDDFILSVHKIRDIFGYENIAEYLERYQYIADIWN